MYLYYRFGLWWRELREVVDERGCCDKFADIYQRPKKNDAFPDRSAYSRGLRHTRESILMIYL